MAQKSYYFDSCIWLNIFKKEGDESKGKQYWKIAKELIEKIEALNDKLYVSTIVLKEISFKLEQDFEKTIKILKKIECVSIIKTNNEDYEYARSLEKKFEYKISFYDCLHIAICKRLNFILITRDAELINQSKNIVETKKPEELIS